MTFRGPLFQKRMSDLACSVRTASWRLVSGAILAGLWWPSSGYAQTVFDPTVAIPDTRPNRSRAGNETPSDNSVTNRAILLEFQEQGSSSSRSSKNAPRSSQRTLNGASLPPDSGRFGGSVNDAFMGRSGLNISNVSSSRFKDTRRRRPSTQRSVNGGVNKLASQPSAQKATRSDVASLPGLTPAPVPQRRRSNEDPFAPVGLRLGSINFLPAVEVSGGYDSNPLRRGGTGIKGSSLIRTDVETQVQSDWSVHALTGSLRGSYQWFNDISGADRPELDARLAYRHDFQRDTVGDVEVRARIDSQRPGTPDLSAAVKDRPLVYTYGASAGLTQNFNRLSVGLRGSIDRSDFEDGKLTNGLTLSQADRNLTQYSLRLRTGYEVSPGWRPFVEGQVDTRQYDQQRDTAGFARDSNGIGARVGSTVELTRQLTGELSVGYQSRHYEDARLPDLRGPIAEGSLLWSVTPLTNVRLTLNSALDETTLVNSSGTVSQRARVEITHDLWRNLTLGASLAFGTNDYRGINLKEDTLTVGAKADYRLTRELVFRTSFTHERLKSTTTGADYTANIFLAGLRLQR
jgi:hypothetical protein